MRKTSREFSRIRGVPDVFNIRNIKDGDRGKLPSPVYSLRERNSVLPSVKNRRFGERNKLILAKVNILARGVVVRWLPRTRPRPQSAREGCQCADRATLIFPLGSHRKYEERKCDSADCCVLRYSNRLTVSRRPRVLVSPPYRTNPRLISCHCCATPHLLPACETLKLIITETDPRGGTEGFLL